MKVLWISNSPFPEVFEALNIKAETAGWVYSAAKALLSLHSGVELAVASFYDGNEYFKMVENGMTFFTIPHNYRKNDTKLDGVWRVIHNDFSPDVVHIHGTEYVHSYSYVRACGPKNVVVSIQGLVSVYERYYFGGIDQSVLRRSTTLRDIVRFDTIFSQHRNMYNRGQYEKKLLKTVRHIIGRTAWDHDHTWAINSKAKYHFCNEILRPSFYKNKWSLDSCDKFSIFISQAHYPIKGFHQLIKALPFVVDNFPMTKLYVAGHDFFSNRGIKLHGFGSYINKLIREKGLGDRIFFTGFLNEEDMCLRFLKSHVFVCPSSIENSPNSVGEAQILGVPCIASFVGGTSDMITHEKSGLLYRFEESEMLASNICRIFSDDTFASSISKNGILEAKNRHNIDENTRMLYSVYKDIVSS